MNTLMKRTNGASTAPAAIFGGMVDKIFQNNISRLFDDSAWGFNGLERTVNVPVNIRETDTSYELELVAPGLKKEDFRVGLNGEVLTVSFEHKDEQKAGSKEQGWLRQEFAARSFTRSFTLDETVDANNISAQYRDGILYMSIPKKEGHQNISRVIEIK